MTSAERSPAAPFAGFPAGARATPVPNILFSHLLPQIEDADELRLTVYVIYALARRRGYTRFVSARELAAEAPLVSALGGGGPATTARLGRALAAAVGRHSLLALNIEQPAGNGHGSPSARKFSTVDELVNVIRSAPSSSSCRRAPVSRVSGTVR